MEAAAELPRLFFCPPLPCREIGIFLFSARLAAGNGGGISLHFFVCDGKSPLAFPPPALFPDLRTSSAIFPLSPRFSAPLRQASARYAPDYAVSLSFARFPLLRQNATVPPALSLRAFSLSLQGEFSGVAFAAAFFVLFRQSDSPRKLRPFSRRVPVFHASAPSGETRFRTVRTATGYPVYLRFFAPFRAWRRGQSFGMMATPSIRDSKQSPVSGTLWRTPSMCRKRSLSYV